MSHLRENSQKWLDGVCATMDRFLTIPFLGNKHFKNPISFYKYFEMRHFRGDLKLCDLLETKV